MDKIITELELALLSLDRIKVREIYEKNRQLYSAIDFIEKIIAPTLEKIGVGWAEGKVALAQIYMSARICEEIIDKVLPKITEQTPEKDKIAITTLTDYHILGKKIVVSVLRGNGINILDYGRTTVEELSDRIKKDNISLLLISTLMLPSALDIKKVIELLKGYHVKIFVGGAPFRLDKNLWEEVGANGMGMDAQDAVNIVKRFLEENNEK